MIMDTEKTIESCQELIQARRSTRHPFITGLRRPLPLANLSRWAAQKYHQVFLQNAVFSNVHARSPFADVRQWMLEQLIAEETSLSSGSDSHYNLMRRFAEACGAPAALFSPAAASAQVRAYVDVLLSVTRDEHFVVGLLGIYSIESQAGESAGRMLAWLRQHERFSEHEMEWFLVHAGDEDDHAERGLRLVRQYAHLVEGFDRAGPAAVRRICDAWLELHDFYHRLLTEGEA